MASTNAPYGLQPYAPPAAAILAGVATSNAATIITVPAGLTWTGVIVVTAAIAVASGGAAVNGSARVSTAGTGVTPAAADYLRLDLSAPSSAAAASGTAVNGAIAMPFTVIAPAGNTVTLVLNTTNTTTQSASAYGTLS